MRNFGLIGYPLGHSFSAGYFAEKFKKEGIVDAEYKNYPIEKIDLFPSIIENVKGLCGLNVTIPYKQQVIPFLDSLSESAKAVGAVNTVKIIRNGNKITLEGNNTDVYGFQNSLQPLLKPEHKKALILGTGGASKAIKYILVQLGIEFISATVEELQENEIRYNQIDEAMIKERLVIINATPLGTYPNVDSCPDIPYQYITPNHVLFDLVYNPSETTFMKKGLAQGAKVKNGLEMLHMQAEKAWEIWNS